MWDPAAYLRFADERSRPFFDLLGRVGAENPRSVVDLGCGPGTLTLHLRRRWPDASVTGLDSSPEMIGRTVGLDPAVRFDVADLRQWHPAPETDVVVANAVLQWVPGHEELLNRWAEELDAGAWLAFQVPGNFDAPSHTAIREVAARPRWRATLQGLLRGGDAVADPQTYARRLLGLGWEVDAWETTYLHVLSPESPATHPVLRWVEGTALVPVRSALDDREWTEFRTEVAALIAAAYPVRDGRVWFPFRRIFVVAHR